MKSLFKTAVFCLAVACISPVFTSCSKDSDETVQNNADKTEINKELTACKALLAAATTADYKQESIDAFKAVIDLVDAALAKDPTQTVVNNLLKQLQEAKSTFEQSAFNAIPEDKLLLNWDFDTEGTSLASTGTLKWNAVLKAGPSEVFGSDTDVPKFVDGVKGKALSFDKGAHLEVSDYSPNALLGSQLSISVWVKPSKTVAGNYIISLNYWNTFKLNLENENKPFFTFASNQGVADCDNEMPQSVPNNKWSHVVIALNYTAKTLDFYVNGELTKSWTTTGKPQLAGSWATGWAPANGGQLPLMIGACTTYAEATSWDWVTDGFTPNTWDCFHGEIDQMKIYSIALGEGQVSKLYNDEKSK